MPNLNDARVEGHAEMCQVRANPIVPHGVRMRQLGDLRYCTHGRVQVVVKSYGRMAGPGTWDWADISKLFDRRMYNTARQLLDAELESHAPSGPPRDLNPEFLRRQNN
ncbi:MULTISPECIES: hypothetical protein [unclassified Cryobacterium]|uniref:hypothetical protein n=1 Tax=unclassified Cryobacterium TaxID=2649013 RepID=UPI00106ABE83|nr:MULTISPECIES: hypothetical protein [unclassified Cryobacterium]TFB96536.1 hypothetical protein E3O39_10715 [Cryobacterium sp. MDB2-A-1]TFC12821.1 hypothetical protein E3O35_07880 [Cryobacterium sp. MDB2-A-2]